MLGTIVNTATIICGSIIGSLLNKGIKEEYHKGLFTAIGLAACGIGINSVVQNMPDSTYPVLFIVSLALGTLLGTALNLEGRFQSLVSKFGSAKLGQGLGTAILLFCIGTLSILGPIQSRLSGDNTFLFTNAALDLVSSMVLASTYGMGIIFAAPVLFLWQGAIYLFAGAVEPYISGGLMTEISVIGGFLIAASGLSILELKDCKTLNMLPALLVPPLWFILVSFF